MEIKDVTGAVGAMLKNAGPPSVKAELVPRPDGNGQLAVIREGYALAQLDGPKKKQRVHAFHDIGSFADWLNRHAASKANDVEILADKTLVRAALAPSDPHGDLVICNLENHPSFTAWTLVFGKQMTQKALHAFIRGNLDSFPGDGVTTGNMLAGELQKLSLKKGEDIEAELDERGFWRFSNQTGKTELQGKIPPQFEIDIPVFIGICGTGDGVTQEKHYPITVLISMEVDAEVRFTLSCPSLPLVQHEARLDAVEWLKNLLDPKFLVGLGELKLAEVPA